jgi:hypothetical protein
MQDAFIWARQSHFSAQMRASLRDLNHRFLDLMAAHAGGWRPACRLPLESALKIAPLSAAQRAAAANCPYALFDLSLDDHGRWRGRLDEIERGCVADENPADAPSANFVRLALFYAWHLAATPKLGAQLWLGMSEATASVFRGITLNCLPALVASEAASLSARWCSSGFYWSALASAAARSDAARLRKVHLFGLQLAAAERLP